MNMIFGNIVPQFAYRKLTAIAVLFMFLSAVASLLVTSASAQTNPEINYQGKLTTPTGVAVTNGEYDVTFRLYTAPTGGSAIWTEFATTTVTNGLFSVMLGASSTLTGVDFNQTLYLGVEVEGDGEMSPRKVLGTVPAAFVARTALTAEDAFLLGGVASSSFLRSDQADTLAASSGSTLLTLQQNGAGDLLSLNAGTDSRFFVGNTGRVGIGTSTDLLRRLTVAAVDNAGARFIDTTNNVTVDIRAEDFQGFVGTISNNDLRFVTNNSSRMTIDTTGRVGIGTTNPSQRLTVSGGDALFEQNLRLTGSFFDAGSSAGTNGQVLSSTGSGTTWLSTSTLGLGDGTLLGLSDVNVTAPNSGNLLSYDGSEWVNVATSSLNIPDATTATYVVAANDSVNKAAVDYIANGTNDHLTIQDAIDALPASGGSVYLMEGTYNIAGQITVPTSTILSGAGETSVLRLVNSHNTNRSIIYVNTADVAVTKLKVDGNKSNQSSGTMFGIYFDQFAVRGVVDKVAVENVRSNGVSFGNASSGGVGDFVLSDSRITGNGIGVGGTGATQSGVAVNSVNYDNNESVRIINNTITENNSNGIYNTSKNVTISNNTISNNIGSGIQTRDMGDPANVTIANNLIELNAAGITSIYSMGVTAIGNQIINNDIGWNGSDEYVRIIDNTFYQSTGHAIGNNELGFPTIQGNSFVSEVTASSTLYFSSYGGGLISDNIFQTLSTAPAFYVRSYIEDLLISGNQFAIPATGFAVVIPNNGFSADNHIRDNVIIGGGATPIVDNGINTTYGEQDRVTLRNRSNDAVGYNLFNITGSSTVAAALLRQTGTGDIADFQNAAGTSVLNVNANGNVGIGTSTPNAKLTVAGDINIADASSGISFMGTRMLFGSVANDSVYLGESVSAAYGGVSETIVGALAGENRAAGDYNTFLGAYAGQGLATSSDSVLIGGGAGAGNATPFEANRLTIIGTDAGYALQSGADNNILLGWRAANSLTTGANNIVIGYDIELASNTGSNQLNIGNLIFGTGVDGTGTTLSTGNIGINTTSPSSKLDVWGDFRVGTSSRPTFFVDVSKNTILTGTTTNNNASYELTNMYNDVSVTNQYDSAIAIDNKMFSKSNNESYLYGLKNNLLSTNNAFNFEVTGVFNKLQIADGYIYGMRNKLYGTNDAESAVIYGVKNELATHDTDVAYGMHVRNSGPNSTGGTQYGVYIDIADPDIAGNSIYVADGGLPSYFGSNVGIGTTTTSSKLTVAGDTYLDGNLRLVGALRDSSNSAGTNGFILQTTGSGTQWVATSSLGIGGGASSLATLSDVNLSTPTNGNLLSYDGSEWVNVATSSLNIPDATTATYVVAANDSVNKAAADYIANGTNDHLTIQAAIDALPASGGSVYLMEGTYNVSGNVNVNVDNVDLAGSGASSTVLKLTATGSSINVINITGDNATIANLGIDGSAGTGGTQRGVYTETGANDIRINHLLVSGMRSQGLFARASERLRVFSSTFVNNVGTGLDLNDAIDAIAQGNISTNNGGYGIRFNTGLNILISGNVLVGNTLAGVRLQSSSYFAVNDNTFSQNEAGAITSSSAGLGTISDNRIDTSSGPAIGNSLYNTTISGNNIVASGSGRGIGSISNSFGGNSITSNTIFISGSAGIAIYLRFGDVANGNVILRNGTGSNVSIFSQSFQNLISNNRIEHESNQSGSFIEIESSAPNNVVTNNVFIGSHVTTPILDNGTNTIYDEQDRVTLTNRTSDAVGYNLFNITGSSTVAAALLRQTGTGDIADFQNAAGTSILNVNANGNVGIGTSSPLAKLAIQGNSDIVQLLVRANSSQFANMQEWRRDDGGKGASISADGVLRIHEGFSDDNLASAIGRTRWAIGLGFTVREAGSAGYISAADNLVLTGGGADFNTSTDETTSTVAIVGQQAGRVGLVVRGAGSQTADLQQWKNSAGTVLSSVDASGNFGIGTTTPAARLSLQNLTLTGTNQVSGLDQYLVTTNATENAVQYGNRFFLAASNTATTTSVGSIYRLEDNTTFANTIRGLEVQTNRGSNTNGENTALSGFARTFGVRGVTSGDAGASFEPAGGFFETEGTTQGNAIRGFSDTITTATLLSLFQASSTFAGTGFEMNFGNGSGSFSSTTSKYLDFQNAGTSVFTVSAFGTTTIGDGTTNNLAGLQIGYGGICVDNDGTCSASIAGRIASVSTFTGNSDLAETYFSSQALATGEIVTLAGELSVTRADKENSLPVLGVVSTKPGLLLGADDVSTRPNEDTYPIALSGRVPVILSTENGDIKKGDHLMLSSIPGVAMKATGTGATIGIALEDFTTTRYYSNTYLNQFGDDLVDPVTEPIVTNTDPRLNDGCYYSGGNATGEEPCVPLSATTSSGQIEEANDLAERASVAEQLAALARVPSETRTTPKGEEVRVGQVVMFVQLGYRWVDEEMNTAITSLMRASTSGLAERLDLAGGEKLGVVALVIEAVTRLWDRVTGAEARLEALEAENETLKQRMEEIEANLGTTSSQPTEPATETLEPTTEESVPEPEVEESTEADTTTESDGETEQSMTTETTAEPIGGVSGTTTEEIVVSEPKPEIEEEAPAEAEEVEEPLSEESEPAVEEPVEEVVPTE